MKLVSKTIVSSFSPQSLENLKTYHPTIPYEVYSILKRVGKRISKLWRLKYNGSTRNYSRRIF